MAGWRAFLIAASAAGTALSAALPAARAQPPPAAAQPAGDASSSPPKVLSTLVVPYPDGAVGEADVVLEVVVGPDSMLRHIKVVEGVPPFTNAAVVAASGFTFQAAKRNGQNVSARFLVKFHIAPTAQTKVETGATRQIEAAPPSAATSSRAPIEVVVEGDRPFTAPAPPPARTHFDGKEIKRIPGAFGDAFRAVEMLPGVVPFVTGLPYFFVRGSTPATTGYFLDGIRLPFLFHIGAGPSVVNPAIVDKVDFYPGGYPAEFGRYVGGIVAATTAPPATELHAGALVRIFDAGAYAEAPFLDGRGNAFVGGRYSYTAPVLSLFAPTLSLHYGDYQFGVGYRLNAVDRVSAFAFGSDDYLGQLVEGVQQELFGAQFHRLQLKLEHAPADPSRARVRAALVFGYDRSTLADQGIVGDTTLTVRGDAVVPLHPMVTLRAGADATADDFSFSMPVKGPEAIIHGDDDFETQFLAAFAARGQAVFGGYLDAVFKPIPRVEIVPGIRFDVFKEESVARAGLDPRASARVKVTSFLTSATTFGISHQRPSLLVPIPGLEPRGLGHGLQQVIAVSQGAEVFLPKEVKLTATVFHHSYHLLTDLMASCSAQAGECELAARADGRAYGLELTLQRAFTKKLGGFVSYTLSRAERTFLDETFISDFDRTHVFNAALGYEFLPGWHAGSRVTAYSGRPFSLMTFDDPTEPTRPTLIGERNALRRLGFYRLDVRVEKRWQIGRSGFLAVVAEGMNVTLQKEIVDFDCRVAAINGSNTNFQCGGQEIGPITIPSLGVEGGF